MLFQLMVEHDHETFWLFQFFLQKTVRAGPELRDPPPQFFKQPPELREALAAPDIFSSPETALWVPEEPGRATPTPMGCVLGLGGKHWS